MSESILVINAGSSSIKFAVFEAGPERLGPVRLRGEISGIGTEARFHARDGAGACLPRPGSQRLHDHDEALDALLTWLEACSPGADDVVAAGHRIVHGGERYAASACIDAEVLCELDALVPMARLHQPFGLAAVRALRRRHPRLLQVACFDTAFHQSLPTVARRYALPRAVTAAGIRRYGFHGLSYAYLAGELAREFADCARSRVIGAHLGSGASLCAMRGGHSIATTMGFTPLEGVIMSTRCGSIDPGILLFLWQEHGMNADALSRMLHHESGLLGISGSSGDMKILLESGTASAQEAIDSYVYSIVKEIGGLTACLGGLDALVFTAGVGELSATIRARICERLGWLGLVIDSKANEAHARRLDTADSRVRIYVIPTDEEVVIARETFRLARTPG